MAIDAAVCGMCPFLSIALGLTPGTVPGFAGMLAEYTPFLAPCTLADH
jgi:hypothetical protein